MQGVLIRPDDLKAAKVTVNKAHRAALGAPKWTHLALLQLPLVMGGTGAPELSTRAALLLATSYMTVSLGRNVLGRAAVQSLVLGAQPFGEGPALATRLTPHRLHLLSVSHSTVIQRAPIVCSGSLEALRGLGWCLAATDGSVKGETLGAAFALWHPSLGVFYEACVGCRAVAAHSTDAEWLAGILLARQLPDWPGELLLASDSNRASHCGLSRAPRPGTIVDILFRATCRSTMFRTVVDVWLPAQHDSGALGTLANLNAVADKLAGEAASRSQPFQLPLKSLLHGRALGVAAGAFCFSPLRAGASFYDLCVARKFESAFPAVDSSWSARDFTYLVLSGTLPPRVVRLAFFLRALYLQGTPLAMAGTLCPFCEKSARDMRHHVWEACLDAFLRLTNVRSSVVTSLQRLSPETLTTHGVACGTVRDAALPEPGRAQVQMSYSGLWRVSVPCPDPAYVTGALRAETAALALPLLVESPTAAGTLRLATEVAPPPTAQPGRSDIRVLDPGAQVLPLMESLTLSLVLRSLRGWSPVMVAAPSFPAPVQVSHAEREEVRVVSLLGAEPYALEIWLAASVDPAVPRLAVRVAPP